MIEKVIADLKKMFAFKNTTTEGDIVLIVTDRIIYAVVASMERDQGKRDEWWHVGLRFLVIPPRSATWTLRTPQFTGQEVFTMGGEPRFIAAIDFDGSFGEPEPDRLVKRKKPLLTVIK